MESKTRFLDCNPNITISVEKSWWSDNITALRQFTVFLFSEIGDHMQLNGYYIEGPQYDEVTWEDNPMKYYVTLTYETYPESAKEAIIKLECFEQKCKEWTAKFAEQTGITFEDYVEE